ncbi:hypothetical protein D3C80_1262860 [compost metagenome]
MRTLLHFVPARIDGLIVHVTAPKPPLLKQAAEPTNHIANYQAERACKDTAQNELRGY